MDFGSSARVTPPLHINSWSRFAAGTIAGRISTLTPASTTWPVANEAFYIPLTIPFFYLVQRVFWLNSSSITSTNRDMGIYSADGARLYSTGSTAATPASDLQYVTPSSPILLPPGRYYLGIATDTATASRGVFGSTGVSLAAMRFAGVLEQASAFALPSSMTGVAATNQNLPIVGITSTASGY